MSHPGRSVFEFGPFRLDPQEGRLLRGDEPVPLPPRTFELLVLLVERSGHLVAKEELAQALWPDTFVEEANLNNHLWRLRRALGQSRNGQEYIETIPKRGFRFVAGVRPASEPDEVRIEHHRVTRVTALEESEADFDVPGRRAFRASRPWAVAAIVAGAAAVTVAGILTFGASRDPKASAVAAPNRPLRSIAILPFQTIGGPGAEDFLGLGLTDALVTRLGAVRQIVVRPTSAVRRYTEPGQDPLAIGREQGVDAVLDGSVQRVGDRVRITVQLYRVEDGAALFSGKYDERSTDVFAVEDAVSRRVAEGLLPELSDEQRQRLDRRPVDASAHEAYLLGRHFWNKRNEAAQLKGIEYFQRAIAIDPQYAEAYAGLADSYLLLADWRPQQEVIPRAREAAARAIEIDPTLAEAHASLALIAQNYDWNWAQAERFYRRALELNPNYAVARHWYGEFLAHMGRFDEGIPEITRAAELDPLSPIIRTDLGVVYFLARRYDRSAEALKNALEIDPGFFKAHGWLAGTYSFLGDHDRALEEVAKSGPPGEIWVDANRCMVLARAGRTAEAREVLRRLIRRSSGRHTSPFMFAMIYAHLGEVDRSLAYLEKTYRDREVGLIALKTHALFDPLRSDPRFQDLIRRVKLES
jgi:DNA-binding winged helix-turn-helix (wHTH) protein/TolB-like protein/Flp pilus assembly protein TadD